MKTINVTFTDEEHQEIVDAKKDLSWHDFILRLAHIDKRLPEDGLIGTSHTARLAGGE